MIELLDSYPIFKFVASSGGAAAGSVGASQLQVGFIFGLRFPPASQRLTRLWQIASGFDWFLKICLVVNDGSWGHSGAGTVRED